MVEFVEIPGIGTVECEAKPENIPNKVRIGDKWVKINKELYLWLWANAYATNEGHRKLGSLV